MRVDVVHDGMDGWMGVVKWGWWNGGEGGGGRKGDGGEMGRGEEKNGGLRSMLV